MTTPQNPEGNPPQWNNPGQSPPPPPQYPGQQHPPQQSAGSYPGYPGGQPGYGQQQHGQAGQGQYGGDMQRPGGVTAAAWIAIVMSALTGLFWLLAGLAMLLGGDAISDAVRDDDAFVAELERANLTMTQFEDGVRVFGAISIGIGLLILAVILIARGVLKGSNGARIALVVASAITAIIGLLLITSVISLLWIAAAIAVIVLLYVGDANRWFESKKR